MDFLKKAKEQFAKHSGGSSSTTASGSANPAAGAPAGTAGKQDYGDKAFGAMAKKGGYNVDQNTQEKITDGARGAYEKFSGKKVDPKYSN